MTLLILGLVLFFGVHLAPRALGVRDALQARLGEGPYKGLYALGALAGLVAVWFGYAAAPFTPVYAPPDAGRALAHALMPAAFVLVAGANMKSNLKRFVSHPMSLGVLLWAALHLANNGDLASVLTFGAFAAFALIDVFVTGGRQTPPAPQPLRKDAILLAAGLVAYAAALWAHGAIFGVYVIGV